MGFEEKTPHLLALLTTYAGGAFLVVPIMPQPPTPAPTCVSSGDAVDKKRKKVQGGKGFKDFKEGEITRPSK